MIDPRQIIINEYGIKIRLHNIGPLCHYMTEDEQ